MRPAVRAVLRPVVLGVARLLGSNIVDYRTGLSLGRALLVPWRGRILVIGETVPLVPTFQPQPRLTYWKQELAFTRHPSVDFPRQSD